MSKHPIEIPESIAEDRAVKRLITAWMHAHQRFHVCKKRVYWNNASARSIEKKRRKEKWMLVARILEIERTLLRWTAKATKHPDIWMSKKEDARESKLRALEAEYYQNRRSVHGLTGTKRELGMHRREVIVAEYRKLIRRWMLAILAAVDPEQRPPKALTLHPREMLPRKLARASKQLLTELA